MKIKLSNLENLFERNHTPKQSLNNDEIQRIKENGLIHICTYNDAEKIVKEGVKPGKRGAMYPKEQGLTWFYIFDIKTRDNYIRLVQSKGKIRRNNDGYVIIKNLSDEQLNNFKIRRSTKNEKTLLDSAIVYSGTLITTNMKAYKTPILYKQRIRKMQ